MPNQSLAWTCASWPRYAQQFHHRFARPAGSGPSAPMLCTTAMTATDWFRNREWNAEIEKDFLAQLARSRTQSDQYLVIQALTICKT